MTNMHIEQPYSPVALKPLLLCCLPESGQQPQQALISLPALFASPQVALSHSAQQRGWLRVLAGDCPVYCQSDCERLILKLNSFDLLIVNPLSLNTLAKFALGLRDSFPAELLWQFSQLGKPILLAEEALPDDSTAMNPHLVRIYRQHWQTVTGGTVCGFNNDNIAEKAARMIRSKAAINRQSVAGSRVFVTREDVIAASESLEPLRVPSNAIITDIAREEASARGVVIVQG
ncbi:MAG: flavoprotein [Candidatus Riflebacteria bacterium]|nr:flavoprotein [Candidatus Riflebacteria bacterium]